MLTLTRFVDCAIAAGAAAAAAAGAAAAGAAAAAAAASASATAASAATTAAYHTTPSLLMRFGNCKRAPSVLGLKTKVSHVTR